MPMSTASRTNIIIERSERVMKIKEKMGAPVPETESATLEGSIERDTGTMFNRPRVVKSRREGSLLDEEGV